MFLSSKKSKENILYDKTCRRRENTAMSSALLSLLYDLQAQEGKRILKMALSTLTSKRTET
jgi:hypothetical protein